MLFDKVVNSSNNKYPEIIDQEFKLNNWSNAYNEVFQLERNAESSTFLYSAQHKDCVILAILLSVLANKNTIVWRPSNKVKISEIDRVNTREADPNRVNMSASLSLLDWTPTESVNSYLLNSSTSFSSLNVCENMWKEILNKLVVSGRRWAGKILEVINGYDFNNRYLCVFEFTDDQLERYVRLSEPFGKIIHDSNMKETIKKIQADYLQADYLQDEYSDFDPYSQRLQARVLCTTKNSIDPYTTYILEPNDSKILQELKQQIEEILKSVESKGIKQRKQTRKPKSKRSKRKSLNSR